MLTTNYCLDSCCRSVLDELKKKEEEMQSKEEKMQLIVESSDEGRATIMKMFEDMVQKFVTDIENEKRILLNQYVS